MCMIQADDQTPACTPAAAPTSKATLSTRTPTAPYRPSQSSKLLHARPSVPSRLFYGTAGTGNSVHFGFGFEASCGRVEGGSRESESERERERERESLVERVRFRAHVVYDQFRSAPPSVERSRAVVDVGKSDLRGPTFYPMTAQKKRIREPNAPSVEGKRFSQFTTFTLSMKRSLYCPGTSPT